MRAIVSFGLVILAGAVVLGLLLGDWNTLRRQVQEHEAEVVNLRGAWGQAQARANHLEQENVELTRARDNALSTAQKLDKDLTITQQERDEARRDAQLLEQALKVAQQELSNAISRLRVLEQSLITTQQERGRALTQLESRNKQMRALEEIVRQNNENLRSSMTYSGPFLQYGLGATLACVLVLVIAGSAKLRRRHNAKRPYLPLTSQPSVNQDKTVMVRVPRTWMRNYAQWARYMQQTTPEHANSSNECVKSAS